MLAAQLLVLLNLVAMTRAFALVSLIEFLLWSLFLFYSPLRAAFLESFLDIRVKLVFTFWAWIAIATLWSPADYSMRFEEVWSWRKLLLFPMAWVLFKESRLKKIAISTLIGTASIYAVLSWSGYFGFISLDRSPAHMLENHATQGVVFASASLLALLLLKHETLSLWIKVLLWLLILGMVSNIIFVLTGRTSYVSLLILAPYGVWLIAARLKLLVSVISLVATVLALYGSDTARSRVIQGFNEINSVIGGEQELETSMGTRWVFWGNTLEVIAANPILGSGSGGFSQEYAKTVIEDEGWQAIITDDPHQQYLLIAGEQGLVGLSIFLVLLGSLFLSRGDDRNRLGAVGILVMTAVNGMFNGHFGSFVEGRLFWIMTGILLSTTLPIKSLHDLKTAASEYGRALWSSRTSKSRSR